MKKISLKNLGTDEILTRDELKKVMGGVAGSGVNCGDSCSQDSDCAGGDNGCKKCAKVLNYPGKYCVTSA